jgi:hypothetical protein
VSRYYITFGQIHLHKIGKVVFDKDSLACLLAKDREEAYGKAMKTFDGLFHNIHDDSELEGILEFYPRGVIDVPDA